MIKSKLTIYEFAYFVMIIGGCFIANVNYYLSAFIKIVALCSFLLAFIFSAKVIYLKDFFKVVIVISIMFVAFIIFDLNQSIAFCCLLIIAGKNLNIERVATIDIIARIIAIIATISFFCLGIIDEYSFSVSFLGRIWVRHSLGFPHPNNLYLNIIALFVDYFILYRKKKDNKKLLLIMILTAGVFFVITICKTGLAVLTFFVVFYFIEKKFNILRNKYVKKIAIYYILIVFIISIVLLLGYNADLSIFENINNLMSGRIKSASNYFSKYEISLFPQQLSKISSLDVTDDNYAQILDSSYYNLILQYGIIFSIFYVGLVIVSSKRLIKLNEPILVLVIMLYLTYGISEGIILNPYYNFSVLFLSVGVYKEDTNSKRLERLHCNSYKPNKKIQDE